MRTTFIVAVMTAFNVGSFFVFRTTKTHVIVHLYPNNNLIWLSEIGLRVTLEGAAGSDVFLVPGYRYHHRCPVLSCLKP
jgi:hypothetical protein